MVKIVDNYSLTTLIGQGQYGKVYHATNLQTKIQVAIKVIPLQKFIQIGKLTELTKNQLQTLKILQDNINIIKFVQMIKTDRNVYLIYQYCQGGTLQEFIKQKRQIKQNNVRNSHNKGYLGIIRKHSTGFGSNIPTQILIPQKQALLLLKQLLNAFKSLYDNNIIHRDVKPNNIFFKSGHLKLADFGFCKKLRNSDDLAQTSLGSPMYMAPEILNGDVYSNKADIWSVGIVLYQMLFGMCPFSQCSIKDLLQAYNNSNHESLGPIIHIPVDTLTPTCQVMLMRMLQKDQFKRISWQDFFYQYQITQYGSIVRRQKDFQYDLMKLMKKSSNISLSSLNLKKMQSNYQLIKFDWSKITQLNSSIHSQQLQTQKKQISYKQNSYHTMRQIQLDQIYTLRKKVKQFEQQHQKMVQLSIILQNLILSDKQYQYSDQICYIIVYNLQKILQKTLQKIQLFINNNKKILQNNLSQNNSINKIYVVFNNQLKNVSIKLKTIRITIFSNSQTVPQIVKYSLNNIKIGKKIIRKYVQQYVKNVPQVLSLFGDQKSVDSLRDQTLFLLKIIWATLTIPNKDKKSNLPLLNIKNETKRRQISTMLNKLLVSMEGQHN